jgi:hypothetical protein
MSDKQSPADLNKDTQTLDMFAELFDPQVVSDFVNHSQRLQIQEHQKDHQAEDRDENSQTLNKEDDDE